MPAMTATYEPEVKSVRLDYTVTGAGHSYTITRAGPSGTPAGVRGAVSVPAVPGLVIVRDFEAPIGVPITYTAHSYNAAGGIVDNKTAAITIPSDGVCDTWLNDLARVTNTLLVTVASLPELDYHASNNAHDVIARRDPIVSSDIAHTPSFDLTFTTDTLDERDQVRALLGNGVPVLLRTPPIDGIGNLYFAVLDYKEQRIVSPGDAPARVFVVNGRQVQRPDPDLYVPLGVSTYAHVLATFATYADLLAQRVNYDAVVYDWSGAGPSDIVPWLPDDV
jgi:hypothetical protein